MSETMTIEVQPREETGKNANRRSRARGKIPAVVYGGGKESVSIEIDRKTLVDMMKGHSGENPIFLLKLGDKERHAMIRNTQVDPVSRQVIHIDFQRVLLDQKVRVAVPVELVGTAVGVKVEGGMIDFVTREVHVECLPGQIPKHLEVDVTELHVGQHVEARALTIPEGVVLLEEPDRVIISLGHGRLETPEEAEADRAEPEVIKKAKAEA
ncbi:MAG: large subunit ribosomal protein [Acidobacteriota bacterium]|jgi:large subunit ribosomal protein L25|nr:large subunit ribosomal protein [Acidobacteriota bacterium]